MKKKLIFSGLIFMMGMSAVITMVGKPTDSVTTSELVLASVEAMSYYETGNRGNKGPREEKSCYKGGHKMVCLCVNHEDCTDSDCY